MTMTEELNTQAQEGHHDEEYIVPLLGNVGAWPGGVYSFIFVVLAALTAVEVSLTFLPENLIVIVLLVALSLCKAYLVVMFYMHLRTDNPIFRFTMIIPLILVAICIAYLIFVPSGVGLGYQ
jgi:cytochrome c oxidase subunit 4